MKLIVGLGNPGRKYAGTRHNLGYMVVDELSRRWCISPDKKRFSGRFGGGSIRNVPSGLLKPETFMNASGQSVIEAVNFYKVAPSDVLVILDDLALPVGKVRVRKSGSAGGHKGLSSVIERLGTDNVPRLRIGIGAAPEFMDPVDYVLGRFGEDEAGVIEQAIGQAADAVESVLVDGVESAMDRFNQPAPSEQRD